MDLKDIKAIIDLMKKNSIAEFELERQDFKIKLKRGSTSSGSAEDGSSAMQTPYLINAPQAPVVPLAVPSASATVPPAQGGASALAAGESEVTSPMIGTFYRAPSPESENYVEIGSEVNADTVVCIIEAMKVMNEIKAEVKGVVAELLVENARPVEFGQPLFRIRPS